MKYKAGGAIPGPSNTTSVTVVSQGRCPLDGYLLVDVDCPVEPGWDHLIPPAEGMAGLQRIADAHGFEVSAAAEQITRGTY